MYSAQAQGVETVAGGEGIVRVVGGGGEGTLGTIRETFGKYKYKMLSADSWPEDLLGGQVT